MTNEEAFTTTQDPAIEETGVEDQDLVYSLAPSPDFARDGICFAGRPSGLYRTADGGESWQFAYETLNLTGDLATPATLLSPDFAHDHTVWAGVSGGILRSRDGGENWEVTILPSPPPLISGMAVSPNYTMDGVLFAGTMEDGVYRSGDRGGRYYTWNFGLLDLHVLALAISPAFVRDDTLYAATETGLFRSTNGGRAWREVGLAVDLAPVLSLALSPNYESDGTLFAGTDESGLYCSNDRGRTWRRLGEDALEGSINTILLSSEFPTMPYVLVLNEDVPFFSADGGASWEPWPTAGETAESITAVTAPLGLAPGAPLLAGLLDGSVVRI